MSRIKINRPFHSKIFMRHNVLDGESQFSVKGGTLTIICKTYWDKHSPGFTDFIVQPVNMLFGFPNGKARVFHVGVFTQMWTDLLDGNYFLRFSVKDHPKQYLRGLVMVS